MNIAVYDDDVDFIDKMKNALAEINNRQNGVFSTLMFFNSMEDILIYAESQKNNPMVFLLDIMTGNEQTGYIIAERIKEFNKESLIIYITNFKEYILDNMFQRIFSFFYIFKDSARFNYELENVLQYASAVLANQYFLCNNDVEIFLLKLEDIYFFEKIKEPKLIQVVHKGGCVHIRDSLKNIKRALDHNFHYSSKEYIVNTRAVIRVNKKEKILYFKNGEYCYYSKTRRKELYNAFRNHSIKRISSSIVDDNYGG